MLGREERSGKETRERKGEREEGQGKESRKEAERRGEEGEESREERERRGDSKGRGEKVLPRVARCDRFGNGIDLSGQCGSLLHIAGVI